MPAFRRNLVLLLCVAFVAASAATAIFYGLIGGRLRQAANDVPQRPIVVAVRNLERGTVLNAADVKLSTWGGAEPVKGGYTAVGQVVGKTVYSPVLEHEPVTQARVESIDGTGGLGIVSGMRAISVHPSHSEGVIKLLRAGHKVDVQAVSEKPGGEMKLRTVVENVEVLAVHAGEGGRSSAPAVTLLVIPRDADRLGLADSGARVRLLLRNPLDQGEVAGSLLTMAGLFGQADGGAISWPAARGVGIERASIQARDGRVPGRVELLVRVFTAGRAVMEEMAGRFAGSSETLQVVALAHDADSVLHTLEEQRRIEAISAVRLAGRSGNRLSMQAGIGSSAARLRIHFVPTVASDGTLRVRVQPEIYGSPATGFSVRKMDTEVELDRGQSFAILGFRGTRELVVIVTPGAQKTGGTSLARGR